MKLFVSFFSILCAMSVMAAEDPSLLFKVNFDTYHVTADFAKGNPKSKNFHADLQLRMHPGIDGKGNAICLNGKEYCAYAMDKNFEPARGTVNVWVSAENWSFNDKRTQVFFDARQSDFRLLIYKYVTIPYVGVVLQSKGKLEAIHAKLNISDWANKKWHMITAVWDADSMSVYIDGKMPARYAPGNVHPAFPQKKFSKRKEFPTVDRYGVFGIGNLYKGFRDTKEEDKTGIDELEIYNRCLTPAEISALYQKKRPEVKKKLADPQLIVPQASAITLDGIVQDAEYADAAHMPMLKAYNTANHNMQNNTKMRLKTDGKNLLLGFTTDLPVTKKKMTKHDQDVYLDDAFEIFIRDHKNDVLYFCVNANGAIYDAKNQDRKWNSGAKAAAKVLKKGWSGELSIPLSVLGDPKPGEGRTANFRTLNFASQPHYFMSWNGSPVLNEGRSRLNFSGNASCVSLETLGNIYKGELNTVIRGKQALKLLLNGEEVVGSNGKFVKKLVPGNYLLEIYSGKNFAYHHDFLVNLPLSISYKSYPASGFVEVKADLSNAGAQILKDLRTSSGKAALKLNGKTVSSIAFKPQEIAYVKLPLPAKMTPGKHQIEITITGKKTLTHAVDFRVPDMTPYQKRVAVDHTVPEPWMKVKKRADLTFDILDRTYIFNQSPFPKKMISRGKPVLLTQPVLTIDGKPAVWQASKVVKSYDDYVVLTGNGSCGDLKFTWNGELWFDGLWKLDFAMTPGNARKIRSMQLKWAVPEESAKCFISRFRSGYVVTPWDKQGKIAKTLNVQDSSWLTGHITGMMWQSLSEANWVAGKEQATVLQKKADRVDVTLNMIAKEVTLNKTAKYSLAFMATPAKRPPKDFRTANQGSYMGNPYSNLQITSTAGYNRDDAVQGYAGHIMEHPEKYRKNWIQRYGARGVRLLPYHQPKGISKLDDEWDFYLAEWQSNPGYVQANVKYGHGKDEVLDLVHCCGEGIADLMSYRLEKLYTDFPELAGIYYDISDVKSCGNTKHGHGGIDVFGKPYRDTTAMTFRHYLMRIYKISHKMGKITFIHAHNYFNPIAHNFTDIWYPGEEFVWLYGNDPDYFYSEIPLPELQYAMSPVVRGAAIIRCNQVERVQFIPKLKPRLKDLRGPKLAIRSFVSAWLHDFNVDSDWINNRAVAKFWKIRRDLNFDKAEFFGYWFNDAIKSASPRIYASWYKLDHKEYSHLIIVGNMGRKNNPAALTVDWKKMGLDGKKIVLKELWDNKDLPLSALTSAIVPENHFLLIGVKK